MIFYLVDKKMICIFAATLTTVLTILKRTTMEIKKTSKANLEKDISLNFLLGIVIGLAILFVGFEWGETEIEIVTDSGIANIIEEEEIEATEQNEPPPPVVEPEVIKAPDIIEIVENTIEVEKVEILSTEDDATHKQIEVYTAPVADIEEEVIDDNYIFQSAEEMPEFPGGDGALMKWISTNMTYPTIAQENGIQGRVFCQFVVNADGSVVDVEVVRGRDQYLDREAVRVLSKLPKFKPGKQRGKPVRVRYSVPVLFQLQN